MTGSKSGRIMPSPPPGWGSWEELVRLALHEARKAQALGEVPVGALVLDAAGNILGQGFNRCINLKDPTAHAEIMALRAAGLRAGNYRLSGAVMAVTLEPCLMCAGALAQARLAGVVYGARDARAGAVESRLEGLEQSLHNHHVWHCGGLLEEECATLLRDFFRPGRGSGIIDPARPRCY